MNSCLELDLIRTGDREHLSASEIIDFLEAPDESETTAGQTGAKLLIKSEPPERKTRKREPGKHRV
ncbi:hypothetical protein, partial [Streptomyces sennicomposti]|uniref:hypothetical protein n=1 Tax=Streptomyces sennicomposti TaxID=2873384 RepID=UPI001CA76DA8